MRHSVILQAWNCKLRPVEMGDAEFIVNLRNMKFVKGMMHNVEFSVPKQVEWLNRYFEREGDYYWIVENTEQNRAVGTMGLYDIVGDEAMLGRICMHPDADIVISVVPFLTCQFAFEELGLRRVVGDIIRANKKIERINELFGFVQLPACPSRYVGADPELDLLWYEMTSEMWPAVKDKWIRMLGDPDKPFER